jgi:hypothetical protein
MRNLALITLGIAIGASLCAASGLGVMSAGAKFRVVTVGPGTLVHVTGVDVGCDVFASDLDHREAGPVMFCNRWSVVPRGSRSVVFSLRHVDVTDESGNTLVYRVTRSP